MIALLLFTIQPEYRVVPVEGWRVHIRHELVGQALTTKALELLKVQLQEVKNVVPALAVKELQKVQLWFSPEYPGQPPRAEFHPGAGWLRDNGRDPAMVKGIEFTNIRIFEKETKRMPNFALHELAHAYHDRVLQKGFANPEIRTAYESAKASKSYDDVERQNAEGERSKAKAYAMTNPMEYFAESTESYFSRNDFFPFNQAELARHDPTMFSLLRKLWGVPDITPQPAWMTLPNF